SVVCCLELASPTIPVSKTDSPELRVEPCQREDLFLFFAPSLPDTHIFLTCSGCKAPNCWGRRELLQKERKTPEEEEEEEKEGMCTDLGAPEDKTERGERREMREERNGKRRKGKGRKRRGEERRGEGRGGRGGEGREEKRREEKLS
ncbi:hypothetical protein NXF25_015497, partial [Crotalus adamanteus]